MEAFVTFAQGFWIVDLGLAVIILFVMRLLGKPLPFEAWFRRVLEWARAHRWI